MRSTYLTAAMAVLSALSAATAAAQDRGLTGTWRSEAPIHYIVEKTPEHPYGANVPHAELEILARSATLEWTLHEHPHGLVTGTNKWIAYDESGDRANEASEPLLGAFDGERWVLTEPDDETDDSARVVFQFTMEGPNRIRGAGYSVSGPKLLAMSFSLVRVK